MVTHKTEGVDVRFRMLLRDVLKGKSPLITREQEMLLVEGIHSELSIQREEYEKKMEILEDVCDKYSKAISLMADGVPYEQLPKHLQ